MYLFNRFTTAIIVDIILYKIDYSDPYEMSLKLIYRYH